MRFSRTELLDDISLSASLVHLHSWHRGAIHIVVSLDFTQFDCTWNSTSPAASPENRIPQDEYATLYATPPSRVSIRNHIPYLRSIIMRLPVTRV